MFGVRGVRALIFRKQAGPGPTTPTPTASPPLQEHVLKTQERVKTQMEAAAAWFGARRLCVYVCMVESEARVCVCVHG